MVCKARFLAVTTASLALATSMHVEAQPTALGAEFQVNTTTTGAQLAPDIAAAGDRFLVVWQNGFQPGWVVSGQRLDLDGEPSGPEFTIPSTDAFSQTDPRVVLEDDGDFVIQWRSLFQSTYDVVPSVRARAFNADTTPAEDAFIVIIAINQYEQFFDHDLEPTNVGTFVMAIADYYNAYTSPPTGGVEARRFTADGSATGVSSLASTGGPTRARVARGANDEFVVTWAEIDYGFDLATLRARRLNADGTTLGNTITIPTPMIAGSDVPDAALSADGSFTVVWSAVDAYYGTTSEIYSRHFGADNLPIGPQQQINTFSPDSQSGPRIARAADGTHLVVWQSRDAPPDATDTDGWSVRGRQLDATGVPIGASFQINQATLGDQVRPVVTSTPDGKTYLVVWQSESSLGTDNSSWSVQARRYAAVVAFRDDFESGDTSAWDQAVP